jgi:uncharacterized cupredoxin-like copper-binding protein
MTPRHRLRTVALVLLALAGTAASAHGDQHAAPKAYDAHAVEETPFGHAGDPRQVTRTIRVGMSDAMRFSPSQVSVKKGQTVKFVISNGGKMLHEMVIGTPDALKEHAEMMRKFPEMEHDAAHMAHVKPGQSGEIIWQFTQPGDYSFACLIPGHFEAGMVAKVVVR